jgi:4-amino-4-deoxy-L-arabinose transferase-like glycosyltransferase
VGGSRKSTARNRAFMVLIGVFVVGWYAVDELRKTHWRSGLGALCLILAFILWLIMTKIRSNCGVLNNDWSNCRNQITGLFFGCHKHIWQRPLAFVGLDRKPLPARGRARAQTRPGSEPAPAPAGEAVRESSSHRIIFYATMLSTCAGLTSATVDLIGAVGKGS